MKERNNWTLAILTIPSRHEHVKKLLRSLNGEIENGLKIKMLYNCPKEKIQKKVVDQIAEDYPIEIQTYSSQEYGLSEGRNVLLRSIDTPLLAFVDDDCSFEGEDIFLKLEETLKKNPVGFLGLPSYNGFSKKLEKPRAMAPQQKINGLLYTYIEGMFIAGYTQLLKKAWGFNERMNWWNEVMELNVKLHRMGVPTAIDMDAGKLYHWEGPNSPTRDRKDGRLHVLYGLMEYMFTFNHDLSKQPEEPLKRIEKKYFSEYKKKNSSAMLLKDFNEVVRRFIKNSQGIERYKKLLSTFPFEFTPLEVQTKEDWLNIINYAEPRLKKFQGILK